MRFVKDLLRRVRTRIRIHLRPTTHDLMVRRWNAENPDEECRYDYDLNAQGLVMDLGGFRGNWTAEMVARYGCKAIVFEPVEDFAARIRQRFARNPLVSVYSFALGASKRTALLSVCENGSSIFRESPVKTPIQFIDVATFLEEHGIQAIDVMKINIEGGEFELLPRLLETGQVAKVQNLQVQFHDLTPDSAVEVAQIREQLSSTHQLTYTYDFVWENWVKRPPSPSSPGPQS